jgi:tetratricopeptide (TPR) repeat protein
VLQCGDVELREGLIALAWTSMRAINESLAYARRARLCIALGQLEKAKADVAKARELVRQKPDAVTYQVLGEVFTSLKLWGEALASYRKAIELNAAWAVSRNRPQQTNSERAWTQNKLAWLLATCPDPVLRDPVQAVTLAKQSVELAPTVGTTWTTLGAAHYRAGDWKAAITALETNISLSSALENRAAVQSDAGTTFDSFFLAMAHWQLGEKEKARQWYDKAVAWMDKNKPNDDELRRFRAEAADLLGLPAVQPAKQRDLTPSKE